MIWSERWVTQHLLRTESGSIKVGFVVQKLHGSEILKVQHFALGARFRALSYIFPALPGAARFALASSCGRMWLVGDDPLFVSEDRTSNLFVTGRGREILVEHEIRDMVTRVGP